ncbi:hypothetical protein F5Y17DRAFT_477170 [Xylariaceae sp. FL0594]|nr:hypothetical protein F5Y17DRAFT_477170 [Xylariaceae sp. FL0594]
MTKESDAEQAAAREPNLFGFLNSKESDHKSIFDISVLPTHNLTPSNQSNRFKDAAHTIQKSCRRKMAIADLLKAYSQPTADQLIGLLAPEFKHRTLPESLDFPVRDRDAFAEHAKGVFSLFASFKMAQRAIYEESGSETVIIHALMEGTLRNKDCGEDKSSSSGRDRASGPDPGQMKWMNECVLFVTLNDANDRIVEIKEFVDSAKAKEMASKHGPHVFRVDSGREDTSPLKLQPPSPPTTPGTPSRPSVDSDTDEFIEALRTFFKRSVQVKDKKESRPQPRLVTRTRTETPLPIPDPEPDHQPMSKTDEKLDSDDYLLIAICVATLFAVFYALMNIIPFVYWLLTMAGI